MRRFLPFAALLGVALVLGCQDVGTGPVEAVDLVPQFAKKVKNCKGTDHPPPCGKDDKEPTVDGTFTATFQALGDCNGDVAGTPDCDVTGGGVLFGPQGGKELISGGGVPLTFTDFLHSVVGGATCFSGGDFEGILQITEKNPGSTEARIQYNFKAKGNDGTPDIGYTLGLSGVLDPVAYAPAIGASTEITGSPGTFQIAPSHGPGAISCKGTGSVNFSVEVKRIT